MELNKPTKLIVGALCASAIAFLSYKVYTEYRLVKDGMISGEELETELEARRLVRELEEKTSHGEEEEYLAVEEIMEVPYQGAEDLEEELEEDEPYTDGSEEFEEGVDELRFPPNSIDALNQYKEMQLAEFDAVSKAKRTMWMLFDVPFDPINQADRNIHSLVVEERHGFFGDNSVWNLKVSIADLILYFAKALDFDLDQGVEHWVNELLYNINVSTGIGAVTLENTVNSLVNHTLVTSNGYGLFALEDDQYAILLGASGQQSPITFMKQYHIFLERQLDMETESFNEEDWLE